MGRPRSAACTHGENPPRGSSGACLLCARERSQRQRDSRTEEEKEAFQAYQKEWYEKNKHHQREKMRVWYEENRGAVLERQKSKAARRRALRRREARMEYRRHVSTRGAEWKKVRGYPYEVSQAGEVRRVGGVVLKPVFDGHGYPCVTLRNKGNDRRVAVHTVVLGAFRGECPPGMEALHDDGDILNSRLDNLRWGTRKENREDARRHGTLAMGERIASAKMTDDMVQKIRARYEAGESQTALSRRFGVCPSTIHQIVHRRTWRHVSD